MKLCSKMEMLRVWTFKHKAHSIKLNICCCNKHKQNIAYKDGPLLQSEKDL